jgi:hypothetical protein
MEREMICSQCVPGSFPAPGTLESNDVYRFFVTVPSVPGSLVRARARDNYLQRAHYRARGRVYIYREHWEQKKYIGDYTGLLTVPTTGNRPVTNRERQGRFQ